jgi:hypothetical protein
LTPLRLPAGSGKRRTEWDSGGLNDWQYIGRMTLPRLLNRSKAMTTKAPPQRRKKKLAYRIFLARRRSAWILNDRLSRTFPVVICKANAADHALGVTGLLTNPSLRVLKMPAPTERSSAPASAVLIPDPCSSLRSLID